MSRRRTAAVVLLALLAGCSDGDGDATRQPDGADRRFCELIEDAPPAPDPFESGIEPAEVERRLDGLRQQFDDLAAVAPDELAADLEDLGAALVELDEVLAGEGYDLAALAESSPDLSRFDDPRFEAIGARIADHRADACD